MVTGYMLYVICYLLLVAGCWLLVAGCWLLVLGCHFEGGTTEKSPRKEAAPEE